MKGFSFVLICALMILSACEQNFTNKQDAVFQLLTKEDTGLDFVNAPEQGSKFNVFSYMYFFNGGGIASADFNNDGKIDLYFTSNMGPNKLFLNKGDMKFEDVSEKAGVAGKGAWTTGASVVDINNDGLLDIYVSQMGDYLSIRGRNELFICTGIEDGVPVYENKADDYGLDLICFSTQSSFFDYDLDGDLDMYLLNHSLHANGTFGRRFTFDEKDEMAGDKLFRNDNGSFVEVTEDAGLYSTVIGYGLGIATGDINRDGWPDIYIGNDFHENDYLYINQKDGTFKEVLTEQIRHTSRFSMGVEIGDINNDGWREILSLDMLPDDPFILKSSLGEDDYGVFNFKLGYGYNHQYARNNLQLNNGDGTFSEIGIYADVFASDWSWAPLFVDFDHDGYKDIFVSNGIPRRMNDIDYIDFRSTADVRFKTNNQVELEDEDLAVVEKMPKIKLENKLFKNTGGLKFEDWTGAVGNNKTTFSNGAVYADLDNDGDLDIIANNIEDEPYIYKNLTIEKGSANAFLNLKLKGPEKNPNAIGTSAIVHKGSQQMVFEYYPVRGYQSSMLGDFHLGLGDPATIDSILLIWPDQTYETISTNELNQSIELSWKSGLPKYAFGQFKNAGNSLVNDFTDAYNLGVEHEENKEFNEFHREKLLPKMLSREGPALAIADVNGDGLEDVFLGGAKRKRAQLLVQQSNGEFIESTPKGIKQDSLFEDVDANFFDADKDGDMDLVIASGGNEYRNTDEPMKQRLYLNNGAGDFERSTSFPDLFLTASCVLVADFTGDGISDLFFGGRTVPWNYGKVPYSYLLKGNGDGSFEDVTESAADGLKEVGFVKGGFWTDIDSDGDNDLLLALEWDAIHLFKNENGKLAKTTISDDKGWWNMVLPYDLDQDGDLDIIAGNIGENSKLKPNSDQPVSMYINDFDGNGQPEQILTYFVSGKEIPLPTFREVMDQMPPLKKDFLYSKDFAAASPEELMGKEKMEASSKFEVNNFSNIYFENQGGQFVAKELPQVVQFAPLTAAAIIDIDGDGKEEAILGGNFYPNNIELGRYDASYGQILRVGENGNLSAEPIGNIKLDGEIRSMQTLMIDGKPFLLIAKNNEALQLIGAAKSNLLSQDLQD